MYSGKDDAVDLDLQSLITNFTKTPTDSEAVLDEQDSISHRYAQREKKRLLEKSQTRRKRGQRGKEIFCGTMADAMTVNPRQIFSFVLLRATVAPAT